jgi:hypothetical protein
MQILDEVGDTIGNLPLEEESFPIFDATNIKESSVEREISVGIALETEAQNLSSEMSRHTWLHITAAVSARIRNLSASLVTDMERRWDNLRTELDRDIERRQKLLRSMMHPKAERPTIRADLRIGVSTASLMAEAIFYQLIVLAALGVPDIVFETFSGVTLQTLALSTWSGPVETTIRRARRLSENASLLMGKESCDILILPQVEFPREYLRQSTLASTTVSDKTLAAGHQGILVITGTYDLKRWIEDSDLDAIRQDIRRFVSPHSSSSTSTSTL